MGTYPRDEFILIFCLQKHLCVKYMYILYTLWIYTVCNLLFNVCWWAFSHIIQGLFLFSGHTIIHSTHNPQSQILQFPKLRYFKWCDVMAFKYTMYLAPFPQLKFLELSIKQLPTYYFPKCFLWVGGQGLVSLFH